MLSGLQTAELTLTKRGANNRRFALTKGGIPMGQDCAPIPGTPYMTCCLPDMTCTVVQRPGSVSPSLAGTCAEALNEAATRGCRCKTNASVCPRICETILKENCKFMTIEHALLANSDASSGND